MAKQKSVIPASLRGKYVSRAAYAKLQGEKNRLLNDIYLMTMGGAEGGSVYNKWRKHFKINAQIGQALREIAKEELSKNKMWYLRVGQGTEEEPIGYIDKWDGEGVKSTSDVYEWFTSKEKASERKKELKLK